MGGGAGARVKDTNGNTSPVTGLFRLKCQVLYFTFKYLKQREDKLIP